MWGVALLYAVGILLAEPQRSLPATVWDAASGFIDWGLITLGILATGGEHSDLYLLYFIFILSRAMRFGLRAVVIAGMGTAIGYVAIVLAMSADLPSAVGAASPRMAYLFLFTVGTGVLAREANRQFEARIREEAQRLAIQEVTATVGHDLRNPLAAVTGLVEVLQDSAADVLSLDQRALLHRVNANVQQMTDLVSNLLDAELIDRGQQPFRPTPVNVNALVRRVIDAQAHQAEEKQIGLVLDLSRWLPAAVLDGHLIERLVANLVSNAVKFTPEGGAIRISTRQRGSRVAIEVWDSGPGVPESLQAKLFDKFVRHDDSPGLGLGLYICQSIVDMHGGTISIQKTQGGGIAFVVELPLARTGSLVPSRDGSARATPAWGQVAGGLFSR